MPADSTATSVPGADGDPDVRGRQSGRVVHPITHHGDLLAALLEALDRRSLIGREDLGRDLIDAQAPSHRVGHCLAIASDHGHPHAQRVEQIHGLL
ncbi:MAG TPA: hypothetical protein VFP66_08260 [Candidatus Limnocylindrales bacterium]|nr:hypothetical protein [Candidatus Limnocylindrales bacterium]